MKLTESRDVYLLLLCGHRLEGLDRLPACFVVVRRHSGLLIIVEDGLGLFALVPSDIVCDIVVGDA